MAVGEAARQQRYDRLLAAIDAAPAQRLHCTEAADVLGMSRPNLAARLAWAIEKGIIHRQTEGRATYYARGPNPEQMARGLEGFTACLCSDGELHLFVLPDPREDGTVYLNPVQTKALREILLGDPMGGLDWATSAIANNFDGYMQVRTATIQAKLWTDGELQLLNLPAPDRDAHDAVVLSSEDRRRLRSMLVKP